MNVEEILEYIQEEIECSKRRMEAAELQIADQDEYYRKDSLELGIQAALSDLRITITGREDEAV